ncbi:MAG TPA: YdbL family protein [Burkholderiales bacterium]|nr:YdbL family protein [Burkholderiales bacterium]
MFHARWMRIAALSLVLAAGELAAAQANLQIDTPAVSALRTSLREAHKQLRPYYESGAVGLARDGTIALRDANIVPLAQRQQINGLIAQGNRDRTALYREIAIANGHPEWENEIRTTFAQRWIDRAPRGWYYQNANGAWVQK